MRRWARRQWTRLWSRRTIGRWRGCHAVAERPETGLFALASIFAAMRDAINGEGMAAPDFAQGLHVQEVVEAAVRASDERRWVDIQA